MCIRDRACGEEAAEKGVCDDDDRADCQRRDVVEVEYILEQLGARAERGSCVDQEEYENDDGADAADRSRFAHETVLKVLRDGDRIVGDIREFAQPHCDKLPIKI